MACEHPGCTRHAFSRGFCRTHYQQLRRTGSTSDVGSTVGRLVLKECSATNCTERTQWTLCTQHRQLAQGTCAVVACDEGVSSPASDLCPRHAQRNRYSLHHYGIGVLEYEKMYESQGGQCLICGDWHLVLHTDHRHDDGAVRGLLCGNCNRAIGLLRDDPARARRAADYLEGNT